MVKPAEPQQMNHCQHLAIGPAARNMALSQGATAQAVTSSTFLSPSERIPVHRKMQFPAKEKSVHTSFAQLRS